jgi:hypothetical protein
VSPLTKITVRHLSHKATILASRRVMFQPSRIEFPQIGGQRGPSRTSDYTARGRPSHAVGRRSDVRLETEVAQTPVNGTNYTKWRRRGASQVPLAVRWAVLYLPVGDGTGKLIRSPFVRVGSNSVNLFHSTVQPAMDAVGLPAFESAPGGC